MNNQDPIFPAKGSTGLIRPLDDRYLDFLTDESGLTGRAESISFPVDENQIQQIVTRLSKQRIPITIQGSRTGICGGCVPTGGHILNLSRMNRISDKIEQKPDHSTLLVEPGVTLSALQTYLSGTGLFWPVDPTETSATLGGIAANHSKGPGSHFYGPVSRYIR
ncbi:MAG: FAD-binding oxidoreductase, partial [Desulfobacterales bacterium]|nr:FAD-binding oxidoreductase [Desulfobacterales bacterium]